MPNRQAENRDKIEQLVGLPDTATQAIHLRNFVQAQGYDTGPVHKNEHSNW